jgi:hypothetical protein
MSGKYKAIYIISILKCFSCYEYLSSLLWFNSLFNRFKILYLITNLLDLKLLNKIIKYLFSFKNTKCRLSLILWMNQNKNPSSRQIIRPHKISSNLNK